MKVNFIDENENKKILEKEESNVQQLLYILSLKHCQVEIWKNDEEYDSATLLYHVFKMRGNQQELDIYLDICN